MRKYGFRIFVTILMVFSNSTVFSAPSETVQLGNAINDIQRLEKNKARDLYRHPVETLMFFEIRPEMTVVEIWPGGGWYTEILAPLFKDNGRLYAAHFAADAKLPYFQNSLNTFRQKMGKLPEVYGKIALTELDPPDRLEIAPPGSADRVLTFRNIHNWMRNGQALTVFKAMHKALKSGGILGVVEHRGLNEMPQDPKAESGYVQEKFVIALAEQAGFELLEKSEINANPKDTKVHPEGVWTLPPTLRLKEKDRDKYLKIGESDRMTLKFLKP